MKKKIFTGWIGKDWQKDFNKWLSGEKKKLFSNAILVRITIEEILLKNVEK